MKNIFATFAFILFISMAASAQNPSKSLAIGDAVPNFTLTDQNGKAFNIKDEIGKHIMVVYFYPKDESMVCTKEACAFRDSFDDYTKAGAQVIGINGGTVQSHKAFADHYKLPFVLLSDPDNKVYKMFGVQKKFFMSGRQTFVVDMKGKIAFSYEAMLSGAGHSEKALAVVRSLNKK
ncbi:peroxiredoxin Q/BCP [Mucilaginibacter sp. UYP25]|uniref:peroxiredoxin n=1 Tax=unclassified Mucilaginibacter TaxID=2617802 RepID=UPI0033937A41